jgi:hypothetical protein
VPSLTEIRQKIDQLLERGIPAPAAIPPDRHRRAMLFAADRYKGFGGCLAALRWSGLGDCSRGLDLGSGVGNWCLAFAVLGGHATGVEMRPEFVAVAEHFAQAAGFADRVRFLTDRIETVDLPPQSFDAAWSHGVLMYTDAEAAIAKAARCLVLDGCFYLGYTTEGTRLDVIEVGLLGGGEHLRQFAPELAIMLNGYLHRAGVYHTVSGRVRMLELDHLRHICAAFGLSSIGEPGVQDLPGRYRGIPATIDLLVRKTAPVDRARERLVQGRALKTDWLADLEDLVQCDCPRLVCDVIAQVDTGLRQPALHDLYARALIRAGRARGAEAARVFENGARLPDLTIGLYRHDRGEFAKALECYHRLGRDHPDRGFLAGAALLQLEEWNAAADEFRRPVAAGAAQRREWIGLVAAQFRSGDLDSARDTYRAFLTTLA